MPVLVDNKKFLEAVIGGIFFGAVYFLTKFQVALEMDGQPVDASSTIGQFFWFAKTFLGVLAAKVAGQELVGLIQKSWPMVQEAVTAQSDVDRATAQRRRAEERARKAEERSNATEEANAQDTSVTEPETSVRQRRSSTAKVRSYPGDLE